MFKCIFLNECAWILIKISLKFILKSPINNIAALVQIMAWCSPGNNPLSEPMMVNLLMQICFTRPRWVKANYFSKLGFKPVLFNETILTRCVLNNFNVIMYLYFIWFFLNEMPQVVEILPHWRQGPDYFIWSILWLLTHCFLVTPYGVGDLGQHWFR